MIKILLGMVISLFLVGICSASDISKGQECLLKGSSSCAVHIMHMDKIKKYASDLSKKENREGLLELIKRTDKAGNSIVFASEKDMKVIVKGVAFGYVWVEVMSTGKKFWVFPTSLECE